MKEEQKAYRSIFKATALFGGVQVFNILLTLIRTKIIAVLLGVNGVGLLGLFNNTLAIISTVTRLGIDQGAIRDISIAQGQGRQKEIVTVVKRWSFFAGLLGSTVTLSLAPQLSQWSFGTEKYTMAFCWLACTLLFDALSKAQLSIFQGLHKLKTLARANLVGATVSLIISIPIYYFYQIDGIVPAIIMTYICSFLFTTYYYRKEKIEEKSMPAKEICYQGKGMMVLGVMLTISGFITTLGSYLFNIYLSRNGGLQDVGLYQAGFNLVEKYIGLIFVAMSTDFYPKLAAVSNDNAQMEQMVNQQAIIGLLIICPIICIFLPTAPLIIQLLLTNEFITIIPFITWAVLGNIFKVASFSLGYILFAKGDSKAFVFTAFLFNTILLIINGIGYQFGNISGLGISFFIYYLLHLCFMYLFVKYRYHITYNKTTFIILIKVLLLSCGTFICILFGGDYKYVICIPIIIYTCIYSFKQLDNYLNFTGYIKNRK